MNTLFNEFNVLPGVLGSCISARDTGILFSNLPDTFTDEMVIEAGNNLGRMMQMAEVKGLDPQSLSIRYDRFDILAVPVVDNSCILLIFCEPGSNTSLVATTAQMLRSELEHFARNPPRQEVAAPPSDKENEYISRKTAQALDTIKGALFKTVGPLADVVYTDCFERWAAKSTVDISEISELIICISTEMNSTELVEEFKDRISDLL